MSVSGVGGQGTGLFGTGPKKSQWGERMATDQYFNLMEQIKTDPYMTQALGGMSDIANMNLIGLGKATGLRAADTQTSQLQNALSARGGGNFAEALNLGAKARIGSQNQGLMTGVGMQSQALGALQAGATARLGLMGGLYNALMGVAGEQVRALGTTDAAQMMAQSQFLSSLMPKSSPTG